MHIHPGGSWSGSGSSDEDLATVSRSLGVTAATLSGWRDAFLDGGEANLATRPVDGEERESDRLKTRLGEMLLKTELLCASTIRRRTSSSRLARLHSSASEDRLSFPIKGAPIAPGLAASAPAGSLIAPVYPATQPRVPDDILNQTLGLF